MTNRLHVARVELRSINRVLGWFGMSLVLEVWDGCGAWQPSCLALVTDRQWARRMVISEVGVTVDEFEASP